MSLSEHLSTALMERWKAEMERLPLPVHVEVTGGEAEKAVRILVEAVAGIVEGDEAGGTSDCREEAVLQAAEKLGRLRRRHEFSMEELVQEHLILRNEFWTIFREQMDLRKVVDFALERRVNGCFDLFLQAAASAYHYEYAREMRENPLRDELTNLYNKSYFHGRLIEELRRSVRYDHQITLVVFQVENRRRLEQSEGEEGLNRILRFLGHTLSRLTRDCDVSARLGETTFAVLLPETGWQGGEVMVERLRKYFSSRLPSTVKGEERPELSWGLASYPEEVKLPEKLYACAVEALRRSRELAGRPVVYRGAGESEGKS